MINTMKIIHNHISQTVENQIQIIEKKYNEPKTHILDFCVILKLTSLNVETSLKKVNLHYLLYKIYFLKVEQVFKGKQGELFSLFNS